jgi:nucleoside-diphosphate-sugar epimerase
MANFGSADTEATKGRARTEELIGARRHHGNALAEFEGVKGREIAGFEDAIRRTPDRVVVTGGTGCVGTAVLELLGTMGVSRRTSFSRRPPAPDRRRPGVRYRQVDVRDAATLLAAFRDERPELVIHLAGQRQPALAERRVKETVSSNVVGTMSVLGAAGSAGVSRVVTASTGKALRFFASEVYAATKKLAEYLVAQGPELWGVSTATTRFTHIVDNSVAYHRFVKWAQNGEPIRLHAPDIAFYAQSAREAAQLLVATASHDAPTSSMTALTNIGWPHDLLDLALDVIEKEQSSSYVCFPGYEPGYVDHMYPGTFDPRCTECSPLFNVIEAARIEDSPLGLPGIQGLQLAPTPDATLDAALCDLESRWRRGASAAEVRSQLHTASLALLKKTFHDATSDDLKTICFLARDKVGDAAEHQIVHRQLEVAAKALGGAERLAS